MSTRMLYTLAMCQPARGTCYTYNWWTRTKLKVWQIREDGGGIFWSVAPGSLTLSRDVIARAALMNQSVDCSRAQLQLLQFKWEFSTDACHSWPGMPRIYIYIYIERERKRERVRAESLTRATQDKRCAQ